MDVDRPFGSLRACLVRVRGRSGRSWLGLSHRALLLLAVVVRAGRAAVLVVGAAAAFALFVGSGAYNFAADEPHTAAVSSLLETMRERSIETRASGLQAPDLTEATRIVQGAGNYNSMCVGCHLAPGMSESELSKGLYPAPPNLSKERVDPGQAFWAIKHGIKASGMPAWGKSMSDEYVWNMEIGRAHV